MQQKPICAALLAHVDTGKTTLTEQLLYQTGKVRAPGRVDQGTAHTDYMNVEKERGISVRSAAAVIEKYNLKLFLLDLPGHVDFISEVERAIQMLDIGILMVSAVDGITPQTKLLFETLIKSNKQVLFFVNKIDQVGSCTDDTVYAIQDKFHIHPVVFNTIGNEGTAECSVRLITHEEQNDSDWIWEQIAESREEWLQAYLDDEKPESQRLQAYVSEAWESQQICPVLYGSALRGIGVCELLRFLALYARERKPEHGLSGVVYRISHDKNMGKLAHVRLYGGQLRNRDTVGEDKIVQIRQYTGNAYTDTGLLQPGEAGVICGLSHAYTGMLIGRKPQGYQTAHMTQPLLRSQVLPENTGDISRVMAAFQELTEEDPALSLEYDPQTEEISICVTGTIQLEILQALVREQYGLSVSFAPPSVIYKETPAGPGRGMDAYTMPKPCWAIVDLTVQPAARGSGLHFASEVPNDQMLLRYQKHVEESVKRTLQQGMYGWQVVDLDVRLIGGSHHPVHTHPLDFFLCTPIALMKALQNAGSVLLEPRVRMQISVPEEFTGRVIGNLIEMRAEYDSPVISQNRAIFDAIVPVASSMDYHVRLASQTGGRAVISSRFWDYHECPLALGAIRERKGIHPLDRAKWILNQRGAIQGISM